MNCTDQQWRQSLISECRFSCPTDLVPYHECLVSSSEFNCLCIKVEKARCFAACFGQGQNSSNSEAVLIACRNSCSITGDDQSSDNSTVIVGAADRISGSWMLVTSILMAFIFAAL